MPYPIANRANRRFINLLDSLLWAPFRWRQGGMQLVVTQTLVSISVKRGKQIAKARQLVDL